MFHFLFYCPVEMSKNDWYYECENTFIENHEVFSFQMTNYNFL